MDTSGDRPFEGSGQPQGHYGNPVYKGKRGQKRKNYAQPYDERTVYRGVGPFGSKYNKMQRKRNVNFNKQFHGYVTKPRPWWGTQKPVGRPGKQGNIKGLTMYSPRVPVPDYLDVRNPIGRRFPAEKRQKMNDGNMTPARQADQFKHDEVYKAYNENIKTNRERRRREIEAKRLNLPFDDRRAYAEDIELIRWRRRRDLEEKGLPPDAPAIEDDYVQNVLQRANEQYPDGVPYGPDYEDVMNARVNGQRMNVAYGAPNFWPRNDAKYEYEQIFHPDLNRRTWVRRARIGVDQPPGMAAVGPHAVVPGAGPDDGGGDDEGDDDNDGDDDEFYDANDDYAEGKRRDREEKRRDEQKHDIVPEGFDIMFNEAMDGDEQPQNADMQMVPYQDPDAVRRAREDAERDRYRQDARQAARQILGPPPVPYDVYVADRSHQQAGIQAELEREAARGAEGAPAIDGLDPNQPGYVKQNRRHDGKKELTAYEQLRIDDPEEYNRVMQLQANGRQRGKKAVQKHLAMLEEEKEILRQRAVVLQEREDTQRRHEAETINRLRRDADIESRSALRREEKERRKGLFSSASDEPEKESSLDPKLVGLMEGLSHQLDHDPHGVTGTVERDAVDVFSSASRANSAYDKAVESGVALGVSGAVLAQTAIRELKRIGSIMKRAAPEVVSLASSLAYRSVSAAAPVILSLPYATAKGLLTLVNLHIDMRKASQEREIAERLQSAERRRAAAKAVFIQETMEARPGSGGVAREAQKDFDNANAEIKLLQKASRTVETKAQLQQSELQRVAAPGAPAPVPAGVITHQEHKQPKKGRPKHTPEQLIHINIKKSKDAERASKGWKGPSSLGSTGKANGAMGNAAGQRNGSGMEGCGTSNRGIFGDTIADRSIGTAPNFKIRRELESFFGPPATLVSNHSTHFAAGQRSHTLANKPCPSGLEFSTDLDRRPSQDGGRGGPGMPVRQLINGTAILQNGIVQGVTPDFMNSDIGPTRLWGKGITKVNTLMNAGGTKVKVPKKYQRMVSQAEKSAAVREVSEVKKAEGSSSYASMMANAVRKWGPVVVAALMKKQAKDLGLIDPNAGTAADRWATAPYGSGKPKSILKKRSKYD
jgi:hypothetical protein